MTVNRLALAVAAGALALTLAACGDKPMVYKQGQYQGKPDQAVGQRPVQGESGRVGKSGQGTQPGARRVFTRHRER